MQEAEFYIHVTDQTLLDPKDARLGAILGWKDFDLFRQPVEFLFPPDAHGRMQKLFHGERKLDGIVFPKVPLRYHAGGYINFDMTIDYLDRYAWRLNFFKPGVGGAEQADSLPAQEMVQFFDFVQDILESPFDGDVDMSMVEVAGLKDSSELDEGKKAELRQEVEKELKKQAVGGRIGQIDSATYGLLTAGDFEEESFREEIETASKALGLAPEDVGIRSQSVAIDDRTLPSETLKQALSQVAKGFTGEIEADPTATSLTKVVSGIEHHRNLIKKALKSYDFRAGKRGISFASNGGRFSILYEGKVGIDGRLRRPDDLLSMVDHADLALEHDLVQLDELFRLKAHNKKEKDDLIFYDLCRACLLSPDFETELLTTLQRYGLDASSVGLRVIGMPPVKRGGPYWEKIHVLHALGFKLWVDRFGEAVTDDTLAELVAGGVIEMPQGLLKKLSDHYDGQALIQQLVKIWTSKSVWVVSQDYTEERWKRRSIDCGIDLYLSNDPMTE